MLTKARVHSTLFINFGPTPFARVRLCFESLGGAILICWMPFPSGIA